MIRNRDSRGVEASGRRLLSRRRRPGRSRLRRRWLPSGVAVLLCLLCSSPVLLAQEEDSREPAFSISSHQTFAPSRQPKVWLQFRQVDRLDFRIYRVKDPIQFFAKLKDAHHFGSEKRELAREKTLLELFHEWKRNLRSSVRDFFRFQLRWETRARRTAAQVREQKRQRIPLDVTAYAQVPLLNREQLVLSWRELLPRTRDMEYREIPVDLHQKGLFLVEVAHRELRAYTLLMITDLALVSKTAPGQILLYVARRDSGVPVGGATTVIFNNHQETARGTTDASGVFQVSFPQIKVEDAIMVAKAEDDVAATSVESFFFYDSSATEYVGYLYTDRPVYRPTHEVNFKGILRARRAGQYSLDIPEPVTVEITDANAKTVYQQKLSLTSYGSFHGKLALGPLAALGQYSVVAHIGEKSVYGGFEVQEYKKPEFEVTVATDKARYLQGESVQATISARYYFGAPVAHGKLKYSIYKARYYFPYWRVLWGTEDYEGEEGEDYSYDYYGYEISQGTGQLDADGALRLNLPTQVDDEKKPYRYRVEAHVTDASNREISGGRSVLVTYATIAVVLEAGRYVYSVGQQAEITVRTVDYDFQPVSTSVQIVFEERTDWRSDSPRRPLGMVQVTTDTKGVAHTTLPVPRVSWITVRGSARDPRSREAIFETHIWVSGADFARAEVEYRRPEIYPDKRFYRPGETASILVVTNSPGARVLVTAEGQQVYWWSLATSEGSSFTVDIPVEERHEPNFFVGVTYVRGEQLFEASKSVSVPATEKVLRVTVETDKPQYKPNEPVTYTLTTKDEQGRPVSAEVSLGVVDEAIYAVRPDTVRPPEKVFYARRWNQVYTEFSTTYWFMGYSGRQKMELAFLRAPTKLADFKAPGRTVQPKVRKYFPDTTYWAPTVVTDSSGRARASFAFPDSLTTWRATARAVSRETLVGQVTHQVITRKNLILRLEIPRFFTQGDTVTITGIVHNYLEDDKRARVSLQAEGVELQSAAETEVNVPKNGEAVITWTIRAPRIGEAKFLGKALTDEESDALELTAPVQPWGLQLSAALTGSIAAEKAESAHTISIPADINPEATKLRIDLSASLAGTLMSALDFLARFPYGCVEQTMSSFLPNILVTKAVKELGLEPPAASVELEQKIAAGLQRLYQFQHEDGGWGWWETDEPHPFMTAYVVAGLAQARDAGYPVDENRLRRGRESLLQQINENPRAIADLRAYMVYALALSGEFDRSLVEGLYEARERHSPYGQALMALLLARMNDARAKEFVAALERSVQIQGPYAWWKSGRQEMLDFSSDNSFEATAHAVKALANLQPKSELLPKAARWLIDHRSDGYYWTSTEQTAMAIYGLIDYLKVSGELKPNYTFIVTVNGKKVAEQRVTEADVAKPLPIVVNVAAPDVRAGVNEIRVEKNGAGVLYWSAFASYFTREPKPAPEGTVALNIVREYFELVPERVKERIVYAEQSFDGQAQSGDVLVVRLTVNATGDQSYLQIEDPIPAGFEFIEQENLYELKVKPNWWDFYCTRREFHHDRAALFSTRFETGQARFHYLLKAIAPGTYQANPARVLPMYEPARQASTRSVTVTVAPR